MPEPGGVGGHRADSGAGGMPSPDGREPSGLGAATRSAGPHPQAGSSRSNAPTGTATARTDRAVLLAPGILSPRKDHRQGRAQGRVAVAMAQAPPLTLIFHGKTRTYQEDRAESSNIQATSRARPISISLQSMPIWNVTCGTCGKNVSADVVNGWPNGNAVQQKQTAPKVTLWLKCPNCDEGSVKTRKGAVYPIAPTGRSVDGLPDDLDKAWQEARLAHSVGAYTASEMMCRKILMHLAVDVAKSQPGQKFVGYVNDLEAKGYITTNLKPVVDIVRQRGNTANHELPASTEQDSLRTINITEYLLVGIYELSKLGATSA